MMMLMMPLMFTSFMYNNMIICMTMMTMILTILLLKSTQYSNMLMYNNYMMLDTTTLIMIILSTISTILILLSSYNMKNISKTIYPIFIILLMTFIMSDMFMFYISFEMVLIPTLILITKFGKQPERLQAGIYLFIYTIVGSLPLLLGILMYKNPLSIPLLLTSSIKFKSTMIFIMAFLMKMPMFLLHLWLPKAHVEAPLEGSMILAAVLLKLGGYGLIRFLPLIFKKMNMINNWFMSISMIGATITGMNCLRQKDMKSLIAYSSVAHMSLVLAGIMTINTIGLKGSLMMMIAHGLSSSALFLMVNQLYYKYHSRNISLFKGIMHMFPNLAFWWFIFLAINISAPPTINMISEIMIMASLINWNSQLMLMIFLTSLMTTSFSIILFVNISHNLTEMNPTEDSQQKQYLSMFIHFIPLIIITMKTETMMY